MNRPQRTNNCGNLRYAGQYEATGKDDAGFATFPTAHAGFRALVAQIKLDQTRGLTVYEFIQKFAPTAENDTESYCAHLCTIAPGVTANTKLRDLSPDALAGMIARREGWLAKDG